MAHYYNIRSDQMDSWDQFMDISNNTGIDDETISDIEEHTWGVREWLISAAFLVVALIILSKSKTNEGDEEDENPNQESDENESSPVERKRPDEETRKSNIMNLFLSERNQQKITSDQIRSKSSRTIDSSSLTEESSVDSISHDRDVDSNFDEEEGLGTVILSSVPKHENNEANETSSSDDSDVGGGDIESNQKSVSNLCAICLEEYHEGETIVWASNKKCPHAFHQDCLVRYLVKVKTENEYPCPCCRQNFFFENPKNDKSSNENSDER